jgi:transposase-like protein
MAAKAKTLCEQKDTLREHLSKYKKFVQEARFICKKCGRAAHNDKRLCKPVALDS